MKQFLAFKYVSYYPTAAKSQFSGDFETIEDAIASDVRPFEWMDLLDCETGEWREFEGVNGAWMPT